MPGCIVWPKLLDPTRLVEDNSACNHDHVATDINSWHAYLPGYAWREHLDEVCRDTFPGSKWNFIGGRAQAAQPLLNSECGNVWGYDGSTGDCDWSWDYHVMMNEFRRHPRFAAGSTRSTTTSSTNGTATTASTGPRSLTGWTRSSRA